MRRSRLLSGSALATTLALVLPGFASASVIDKILIDESVEGQDPTVTSDIPGFTLDSVTPITNGSGLEEWTIKFSVPANQTLNTIGGAEGGLYEPGTNQSELSDLLAFSGVPVFNPPILGGEGSVTISLSLLSDSDTAGIGTFICTFANVTCLTENGDFQTLLQFSTDLSPLSYIELKSDLDAVPEPWSLALLAGGLGAFGLLRRRGIKVI